MRLRKKPTPELQPITFLPVKKVFRAMVSIEVNRDISGWASREKRQKWHMGAGTTHIIDEDKAREFVAKGYASFTDPMYAERHPISADEVDEHAATMAIITPGGSNG